MKHTVIGGEVPATEEGVGVRRYMRDVGREYSGVRKYTRDAGREDVGVHEDEERLFFLSKRGF